MTGYVRNDITNQITNGNVIDAIPLDGEFDAIQTVFDVVTGHRHDGSAGEGASVTVLGPTQDLVASGTTFLPKTTNTISLGSSSLRYKDLWVAGSATIATISATSITGLTTPLSVAQGGTGVTTVSGILSLLGFRSGITTPSKSTILSMGLIQASGTPTWAYNVASVSRVSAGLYTITFFTAIGGNHVTQVIIADGQIGTVEVVSSSSSADQIRIRVGGVATDADFYYTVAG